jgi:MFS family permease
VGIAINYGGLAIGCIFFVPFVHKFGRRPLYLFSSALQLASVVWQAKVHTFGDLIGSNLISGLGGAISETMVQITIADIFFVHQHALMNGWYLVATGLSVFLGPVASGYVVESQGWRWMWWWCAIFMSIQLLLVVFMFEESKYIPSRNSDSSAGGMTSASTDIASGGRQSLQVSREGDRLAQNVPTAPSPGDKLPRKYHAPLLLTYHRAILLPRSRVHSSDIWNCPIYFCNYDCGASSRPAGRSVQLRRCRSRLDEYRASGRCVPGIRDSCLSQRQVNHGVV